MSLGPNGEDLQRKSNAGRRMKDPEFLIISINLIVVCAMHFVVYPRLAGNDIDRISGLDIVASFFSLSIAGLLFWDTGQEFNAIAFTLNWFWFSILTYAAIELPFAMWYCKTYKVRFTGVNMNLEVHRRDDSADAEVRLVKVYPKWLTDDQYEEIPRQEAMALSQLLIKALPPETLVELTRLLSNHAVRA